MTMARLLPAACAVWCLIGPAAAREPRLDDGLVTTYQTSATAVTFTVCGTIGSAHGCFGGGTLSPPFHSACALIEGAAKTAGNVMSRDLYVLDRRTSASDVVTLYVFRRTDTFTAGSDAIAVKLSSAVHLGIPGGSAHRCTMAANHADVYAGTDAVAEAVAVNKRTHALRPIGDASPPATFYSATADDRGFVAASASNGFFLVNPEGQGQQGGGGRYQVLGSRNAFRHDADAGAAEAPRNPQALPPAARKKAPEDKAVYAIYDIQNTTIRAIVCGSTPSEYGCFCAAYLDPPFGRVCAAMAGRPQSSANTIARALYVLDSRSTAGARAVLYVFQRIDTFNNHNDTLRFVQTAKLSLSVAGGPGANCFMAANDRTLYLGSDAGNAVTMLDKRTLALSVLKDAQNLVNLTADQRGTVVIRFQDKAMAIDPSGNAIGPVTGDIANTRNALLFDR